MSETVITCHIGDRSLSAHSMKDTAKCFPVLEHELCSCSEDRSWDVVLQNVILVLQVGLLKARPAVLHRAPFSFDQVTLFNMNLKKVPTESRKWSDSIETCRSLQVALSNLPKLIHGAFIHCYMKGICMLFIFKLGLWAGRYVSPCWFSEGGMQSAQDSKSPC